MAKILAILDNRNFKQKTAVATFWATIREIGILSIPTSGHTGPELNKILMWKELVTLLLMFGI